MNPNHIFAAAAIFAVSLAAPAEATQDAPQKDTAPANVAGVHDFDFLRGSWRVHHRKLKERLAGSHDWVEFDGTCTMRPLMDGTSNVDDNELNTPDGPYRGVGLRAYDAKTGLWQIWWLDSRMPHNPLDPPVKGRFENGVGTFVADDTLRGKPIKVRFVWSHITANTAQWEQAYSPDGGKTWELNWHMDFERTAAWTE